MQQHIQAGAGQQTKPRKGVNVLIQTSGLQTSCKEKGSAAGNGKKEKRKVMDQKASEEMKVTRHSRRDRIQYIALP